MEHLIGKTLGQYQIVSELGHGGMAVVYKAYQPSLQRYVAIKVLPAHLSADQDFARRFEHEAIAAARLKHPNIVTIHDVGAAEGINYIVMELVEGESLAAIIRRAGAMQPERVTHIIAQVASALDYAHTQGFVHRDIKPSNIMLDANDRVTLMDFGIAKAMSGTRLTQTGAMIGTPEYMSPEQIRGMVVDHHADIYSLGIVTYEMLAGQVPFSGDTASVLYKQAHELPPPIRSRVVHVPTHVAHALERALDKEPNQRFATAGAFAQALGAGSGATSSPHTVSMPVAPTARIETPRPKRRYALWAIGGVIALAVICAIAIGAIVIARTKSPTDMPARYGLAQAATSTSLPLAAAPLATQPAAAPIRTAEPVRATATLAATLAPQPTAAPSNTPAPPTGTATPSRTVTYTPACPPVTGSFATIWQAAKSKLGCAASDTHEAWMAEETFQRGRMFWRKDKDDKYVIALYSNGTWGTYLGDWKEGDPTFTCGPESSPPTPLRGFGRAWCKYPEIRNGLGNATDAEWGYDATVQDFAQGMIWRTDSGATYVLYSSDLKWETR